MFLCKSLKLTESTFTTHESTYLEPTQIFIFLLLSTCRASLVKVQQEPRWSEVDCYCTTQYDPVCATDMRRYTNWCYYNCRTKFLKKNNLPMIDKVSCYEFPSP